MQFQATFIAYIPILLICAGYSSYRQFVGSILNTKPPTMYGLLNIPVIDNAMVSPGGKAPAVAMQQVYLCTGIHAPPSLNWYIVGRKSQITLITGLVKVILMAICLTWCRKGSTGQPLLPNMVAAIFPPIYGRVFAKNIISCGSLHHGLQYGRWTGYCIGAVNR